VLQMCLLHGPFQLEPLGMKTEAEQLPI